jgi:hypothetical protein
MEGSMRATALLLCSMAIACGGGELSRSVVTTLPDGNATGSAASGSYLLSVSTTACSGACPTFKVLFFDVVICKVGDQNTATATVKQTEGRLEVDSTALLVEHLAGGINSDGAFDIGGAEKMSNDAVDVTVRARGTLLSDGQLSTEARAHGVGVVDSTSIDCTATYQIGGSRKK